MERKRLKGGICLAVSGIDCSGKSTQIELLSSRLEHEGLQVVVLWHRPGYSRMLDDLRALIRRLLPGALPRRDDMRHKELFAKPLLRRTWITVSLVETIVQYAVRLRAMLLARKVVICDRYVDDALLDLDLRFPEFKPSTWALARWLRRLAPKPDIAILFSLPWEKVVERAAMKREPFPEAREARKVRYEQYCKLSNAPGYTVVDSSPSIDVVQADMVSAVDFNVPVISQRAD